MTKKQQIKELQNKLATVSNENDAKDVKIHNLKSIINKLLIAAEYSGDERMLQFIELTLGDYDYEF